MTSVALFVLLKNTIGLGSVSKIRIRNGNLELSRDLFSTRHQAAITIVEFQSLSTSNHRKSRNDRHLENAIKLALAIEHIWTSEIDLHIE